MALLKRTFINGLFVAALGISSSWLYAATPVEQRVIGDDSYPYYGAQPMDQGSNQSRSSYNSSTYNSDSYNSDQNYNSKSDSYDSDRSYDPNRDYQQNSNSYGNTSNSNSNGGSTGDPMWDILNQIERLQNEVAQLHGLIDKQQYEIQQLQKQQKQHYMDLDQRIEALGGQPGGSMPQSNNSNSNNELSMGSQSQSRTTARLSDSELKSLYQQALKAVKDKNYSSAEKSFNTILEEGGQSFYVPFSHYWLAEVLLAQKNPDINQAQRHFETVINEYSNHSKVAPSLYKLGTIYNVQGNSQKAKETLNKLLKEFPGTPEANMASHYLDQMKM